MAPSVTLNATTRQCSPMWTLSRSNTANASLSSRRACDVPVAGASGSRTGSPCSCSSRALRSPGRAAPNSGGTAAWRRRRASVRRRATERVGLRHHLERRQWHITLCRSGGRPTERDLPGRLVRAPRSSSSISANTLSLDLSANPNKSVWSRPTDRPTASGADRCLLGDSKQVCETSASWRLLR